MHTKNAYLSNTMKTYRPTMQMLCSSKV